MKQFLSSVTMHVCMSTTEVPAMCVCVSVCMFICMCVCGCGRTSYVAVVEQAADVIVLQQVQQQPAVGSR